MTRKVIIDTDIGIDDAHAILIFLEAEARNLIKIEAITLTAGNTSVENECKNIVRLLESENRTDIPIFRGVEHPLLKHVHAEHTHFGLDGFGDIFTDQPDVSIIRKEPSPVAICNILNLNPGKISLVCLGPLTNIALAAKLDSRFFDKVEECFIMGGNYQGKGNATSSAEFNFHADPEAAYIVLNTVSCPTTIVPLETCHNTYIDLDWRWQVLANCSKMALMNRIEKSRYPFVDTELNQWVPFDGFLAIIILHQEVVKRKTEHHITVELNGSVTRGQVVVDHLKGSKANVSIVEELDVEYIKRELVNMLQTI